MKFAIGPGRTYPLNMGFLIAGAGGLIPGVSRVSSLGINSDIDTLDQPEDIWSGANLGVLNGIDHKLVQIPSAPVSVELVSSSSNDSAAGTGVRTVIVSYLDSSHVNKTVTLTTNGTTPVALPEQIMAVNGMIRGATGTFRGSNIGNVSLRATGGLGATYAYMVAGRGFSNSSLYTVPSGFSLYVFSLLFSVNRTDTNDRWGNFTLNNLSSTGALAKALEVSASTVVPYRHEAQNMPLAIFTQKSSIWLTCESVSLSNTNCTSGFAGLAIQNTLLV